jgi:hypothetical protein
VGNGTSATYQASTNYTVPSAVTTGSLTSSFQFSAALAPTQETGPNGDMASTTYDSYARLPLHHHQVR